MTNRRHVLQWLAAAPALSACGGSDMPDPAAAWRDPGAGETDPRRFALAHAILAPNPHNTQPWQVAFEGEDTMTLYCDLERRLPFTDPRDRQITLGCGAFTYLNWMAIRKAGHGCEMSLFPDGAPEPGARLDARPFARLRVTDTPPIEAADPLIEHLKERRTNRNPYEDRAPSADALAAITEAAGSWMDPPPTDAQPRLSAFHEADPTRVAALRDLVWRAFDRELRTRGAQEETYSWLRFGRDEVARHRDGLAIDGPMVPLFKALGFLDREDFLNPDSTANKQAADDWRRKAETSPAFVWLNSTDDAATTRLLAGMAYARMNLAATSVGLAMHPWSQALQEYEEMADLYREAREILGAGDNTIHMLVRVGYAAPVAPSARRDVAALLRPASP